MGWRLAVARRSGQNDSSRHDEARIRYGAGAGAGQAGAATGGSRITLLLVAALFCQFRLLCNLFDGMVAIEGGKQELDGPFWNEFPDRVADILIFVGVGYGVGQPALGCTAAAFAVLTPIPANSAAIAACPPISRGRWPSSIAWR